MNSKKTYWFLSMTVLLSYAWIYFTYLFPSTKKDPAACLLKNTTSIPCPLCGTTRSVLSSLNGDIPAAWFYNPFGIFFLFALFGITIWLMVDLLFQKKTIYRFLFRHSYFLLQKKIWIPIFILLFINWMFLIYKGI